MDLFKILEVVNLDLVVMEGAVILIIRKREREREREIWKKKKWSEILGGKRKQKLEKEERGSHNTDMNYIQQQPPPCYIIFPKFTFSRAHYNVCLLREYHYLILFHTTRNHERGCGFFYYYYVPQYPSSLYFWFYYLSLVLQWLISPKVVLIITYITIENCIAWNV